MTFRDAIGGAVSAVQSGVSAQLQQAGGNPPNSGPANNAASYATYAGGAGVSLIALFLAYKVLRYFGIIPKLV